jgi:ribosomal-protein-alanine N-acetyltransferase
MQIEKSVFEKFPVLYTQRLVLRELRSADAMKIFSMRSNGIGDHFLARLNMSNPAAAERMIEKSIQQHKSGKGIGWVGVLKENNEIVGTCGFNNIDHYNMSAEIGGELSTEHWGKKMAGEAVYEIIRFGFNVMNLHTIQAKVSPGNKGAILILKQMGFKQEALFTDRVCFNGKFSDLAIFSLIKGEQTF